MHDYYQDRTSFLMRVDPVQAREMGLAFPTRSLTGGSARCGRVRNPVSRHNRQPFGNRNIQDVVSCSSRAIVEELF